MDRSACKLFTGTCLHDLAMPAVCALASFNLSILSHSFQVAFVDNMGIHPGDSFAPLMGSRYAPQYRALQSMGFLCPAGVWCVYRRAVMGSGDGRCKLRFS
jgi:hypothetical protein